MKFDDKKLEDKVNRIEKLAKALSLLIDTENPAVVVTLANKLRRDCDDLAELLADNPGFKNQATLDSDRESKRAEDDSHDPLILFFSRVTDFFSDFSSRPDRFLSILKRNKKQTSVVLIMLAIGLVGYVAWNRIYQVKHGLLGEYFMGTNLGEFFEIRRDTKINFRWRVRGPMSGMSYMNFSVRWTGFIRADVPGTYEFTTVSDDGVRLWVGDQQLVDNWTVHGEKADSARIDLKRGLHPIKLEFFQGGGPGSIRLSWRQPGSTKSSLIDTDFLYPERSR